jgi:hypothetical protein
MKLIKKTSWKVVSMQDYNGVCHSCNSPVSYDGGILVIEFENTAEYWRVVPVDIFVCPHCNEIMKVMMIYKSLEVSKELSKL